MRKNKLIYHKFNPDPFHTHAKLLKRIPIGVSVLEIGSATGYFTDKLLRQECQVTSVEKNRELAVIARRRYKNKIINCNANKLNKFLTKNNKFDFILLADVLEHLEDPEFTLNLLKKYLLPNGRILTSVPNIANFAIRLNLFFLGQFDYQEYGIMDRSHLRFFTKKTIEEVLKKLGFEITYFDVVSGFEVLRIYAKTIGRITFRIVPLRFIEYFITRLFPSLFSLEFIYEAKIK